jgi:Tol biopolymer transport system component
MRSPIVCPLLVLAAGCQATPPSPLPGAEPADHLIRTGEVHFAHLWKLTSGGENAEGYWSFGGDRLVYQARNAERGVECDRIYVTGAGGSDGPGPRQVSNGRGKTTCAYFLPDDRRILFSSTHAVREDCPPPPDFSQGYVWDVHPEFDVYELDLAGGVERALLQGTGYDAEATVSPLGDRIVFTSSRSGDLELWTCDLDGSNLFQVTDELGYDGGAFFSHDGRMLVYRRTAFTPGREEEEHARYRELLANWKVQPSRMEIMVIGADGSNRRQVTRFFVPDDTRILFSSNFQSGGSGRNFDLFAVDVDGTDLERITWEETFDSFPMFSPDGRYLAFASNRGGEPGETNLFVAEWR